MATPEPRLPEAPADSLHVPDVRTHLIESRHVDQTYQIKVMMPPSRRRESGLRFPTLYLSDANLNFELARSITQALQVAGEVQRFILVGIGYPSENPFAGNVLRYRDMTPHYRPEIPGLPRRSMVEGVSGIEPGRKRWRGAAEFLAFIRQELIPLIDEKYPTRPGERAYFGHSLGGGFGLHALFTHPDLFNGYIISSPSVSFDGEDYGIEEAKRFIASGARRDAKVVMTVGDQEEFDPSESAAKPRFVSSFYRLAALLRQASVPGLDLHCRAIPDETHVSVLPVAFTHGVQRIFGPGERMLNGL